MDRRLAREVNRAHRQEVRAERKEGRLHNQAVRAALHGNIGKAINKEMRANNQAAAADKARSRELAATSARIAHASTHHCCHGNIHHSCHMCIRMPRHNQRQVCPPAGRVSVCTYPPPAGVTTVTTTYTGPPPPYTQYPASYPVGTAPPPPQTPQQPYYPYAPCPP